MLGALIVLTFDEDFIVNVFYYYLFLSCTAEKYQFSKITFQYNLSLQNCHVNAGEIVEPLFSISKLK